MSGSIASGGVRGQGDSLTLLALSVGEVRVGARQRSNDADLDRSIDDLDQQQSPSFDRCPHHCNIHIQTHTHTHNTMAHHHHGPGKCSCEHDPAAADMGLECSLWKVIHTDRVVGYNERVAGSAASCFKPWDQRHDRTTVWASSFDALAGALLIADWICCVCACVWMHSLSRVTRTTRS